MKRILFTKLIVLLVYSSIGQAIQDPIIDLDIHYGSDNVGPHIYLYGGDKLQMEYTPHVGIIGIYMAKQTADNGFRPVITPLVEGIQSRWVYQYPVDREGCYTILFKPGGRGFVDSNLKIARASRPDTKMLPTTCITHVSESTIEVGEERFLSKSEVTGLTKRSVSYTVQKLVHEEGGEYCEIIFNLNRGQSAVILLKPDANKELFTHVNVYREVSTEQRATILNDFQSEIDGFGFQSLYGGEYVIHYWGENIFNRPNCVSVMVAD